MNAKAFVPFSMLKDTWHVFRNQIVHRMVRTKPVYDVIFRGLDMLFVYFVQKVSN